MHSEQQLAAISCLKIRQINGSDISNKIKHFLNLLSWKFFGNKFHQNIEKISEINDSVYQPNGWIWSSLPVKYFYTH